MSTRDEGERRDEREFPFFLEIFIFPLRKESNQKKTNHVFVWNERDGEQKRSRRVALSLFFCLSIKSEEKVVDGGRLVNFLLTRGGKKKSFEKKKKRQRKLLPLLFLLFYGLTAALALAAAARRLPAANDAARLGE